jgi:hypothetical protein
MDKRLRYLNKRPMAKGRTAPPPKTLRVRITGGRLDLEQLSEAISKAIARLQDHEVSFAEDCALTLAPLGGRGERMALKDGQGREVEVIEIHVPAAAGFDKASAA